MKTREDERKTKNQILFYSIATPNVLLFPDVTNFAQQYRFLYMYVSGCKKVANSYIIWTPTIS